MLSSVSFIIAVNVRLAETVINVMDKKGKAGCKDPTWIGFQNGNGTEIGVDIERLIKQAKRFLANVKYHGN